jgi:alpha-1,4-digalacturonate transport system substrate-binding protein
MARVTDLGGLSEYFLDLRPFVGDAAYWETNFGLFGLDAPRGSDAIPD